MSKKFLRPPAQQFDDSESEEDDRNANLSSDDDDDDEDEEEIRRQQQQQQKKRKAAGGGGARKKSKQASFFELEAEDDDEEEEDERRRYGRGRTDPDGEQMDAEAREIMAQQDRRRRQAGMLFSERTVEEMAEELENRHRMQSRAMNRGAARMERRPAVAPTAGAAAAPAPVAHHRHEEEPEDVGPDYGADYGAVSQQSLLPSVKDPRLWMINCLTGKEQELVYQIMNKCVAYARQGTPLGITAAIAAQTKGKIYIESYSEPAAMEAIQNIRGIMPSSKLMVPIGDMTTVMAVTSKKKPVKKNEWVRMTRRPYNGDLALVKEVKDSGLKCIIQCVPRLDLTLSDLPPEEARAKRRNVRPPQKFFNSQEIAALGKHSLNRQRYPPLGIMCDYFEGNYYHDGYLLKEMTVGSMVKPCTDDDPPSLDELQAFQRRKSGGDNDDGEENDGSKMAGSLLDELASLQKNTGLGKGPSGGGLQIGDTVIVIEGDLINMRGKLVSQDGTTVKVKLIDANVDLGGRDEVEFLASQVRKHIAVGAHVKVTDGRYANETGQVVAVQGEGDDTTAVLMTHITQKEITVRISQVRESTEVATVRDRLENYELFDLVQVTGGGSQNEVGVIVRVGREDFTIINNHNIAREVRPEELRGKLNTRSNRAVALDVQGSQLRCGDTVNIVEGTHKGKSATVKRMNRSQLWLHSQMRSDHAGIFVVRARSCMLAGSNSGGRRKNEGGVSPFATPASNNTRGPPRGKRDDALHGKTVRIQAGQYKGYLGIVCDTTATHVQVELHGRLKKVTVALERVAVEGDKFGATRDPTRGGGEIEVPQTGLAPTTPFVAAGQTPMHGGATPMHGVDTDTTDDVWRPGGAVDQEPDVKEDDGWGASSSTIFGDENDGWGATNTQSDWGAPSATKTEENGIKEESKPAVLGVKQEHQGEMDADLAETVEMPAWFMERVCVEVKSSQKKGVIRHTQSKTATIEYEDSTTGNVSVDDLGMVAPVEHDTVLVTGGNEIGLEGSLVCIDGTDAILKVANDDFKIVEVDKLAKVVSA